MSNPDPAEAVLVDTDVYSYLLSDKGHAAVYRKHVDGKLLAVSFVTVGELYYGAAKKGWGEQRTNDLKDRLRSTIIVPYDAELCMTYADVKNKTRSKGRVVADNDLWIACCAIRHSIPLVTNNWKHFKEIPGLVVKSEVQAMREIQSQGNLEPTEV